GNTGQARQASEGPPVRRLLHQSERDDRGTMRSLWNDIDPDLEWTESEQLETQLRSWVPDTRLARELSSNRLSSRLRYDGLRQPLWASVLDRIEHRQGAETGGSERRTDSGARALRLWFVVNVIDSRAFGVLCLELWHQEQLLNGNWGRLRRSRLTVEDLDRIQDAEQRRLLTQLLSIRPIDPNAQEQSLEEGLRQFQLGSGAYPTLLRALAATGSLVVSRREDDPNASSERDLQQLRFDEAGEWSLLVNAQATENGEGWRIDGLLCKRDQSAPVSRPLGEATLVLDDGLVLIDRELTLLDDRDPDRPQRAWLEVFRREHGFEVKRADRDAFVERWWSLAQPAVTEFPTELSLQLVKTPARAHLSVHGLGAGGGRRSRNLRARNRVAQRSGLRATLSFDYERIRVSAHDPRHAIPLPEQSLAIQRDRAFERECLATLQEAGARPRRGDVEQGEFEIPTKRFPMLARQLLDAGWLLDAENAPIRTGGLVKVGIASNMDWFELTGELSFGTQSVPLPEILQAAASGSSLVRLGDGSHGMLPEDWLARFGALIGMGEQTEHGVRFEASQTLLLDALLAAQSQQAHIDHSFEAWRDRLQALHAPQRASPGPSFKGELRGYQQEGLGWMRALAAARVGGVLADDMGLGKTVQVLALLAAEHLDTRGETDTADRSAASPSLVVVPRSLVFNWKAEAIRFVPDLRVLDYTGTASDRERQREQFSDHDLIITTYGTLRRDIGALRNILFRYAVLDEATAIKNPASQVAKVSRLIQAEHRLAMTGTPVENHLSDLWSLFEFLNPGYLGPRRGFGSRRRTSGSKRSVVLKLESDDGITELEADVDLLRKAIRPFLLRRRKDEVARDLPDRVEQTVHCSFSEAEQAQYDRIRTEGLHSLSKGRHGMGILRTLVRLRRFACAPSLVVEMEEDWGSKEEVVWSCIEQSMEEHKILIFSSYVGVLDRYRSRLDELSNDDASPLYSYLTGSTTDRPAQIARFREDPTVRVFLISLKAGGEGLNLPEADHVYIIDPWWNPAAENQAIDRAHRIGQTKKVMVFRFICTGSVEEKILDLQVRKSDLARSLTEPDEGEVPTLEELRQILLLEDGIGR
ncbi:MAG: DEAD/DEAH box helicase, partial [Gammaproteobacteria bacterium]|nr:DEAD/DEAH box helicase [Gammaproteobacteria bacterium]